ncbi:MAG: mitochondrial fission ELM1 family protein, partial [Candidatus Omnitrophica bacterium]|nr:mitochondrial fission ELM1 family protein [Candidatus Omnitrophota bacterium]
MLDYIVSIIIRFLNLIFSLIPISISLWVGRRLGTIAFIFNKKRRLIAYANLKAAFCKERSPGELRAITKKTYQNLVETFVEILNLTKVDKGYAAKYVEIINFERVKDAAKSGRGVILLTAHFGDWELLSLTSAMVGFPITVLVREQKMKRVNELLNRLRESKGCKVVRKGISTKNLLRALYDKNIVGILSDQDAGRNGVFVDFFGRPTSCHSGTMEMAKRTDSIIIPNFIVRRHGPYHKVFLEEYIDFRLSKGGDDIKENLQKYAALLENYVRRYPDQWLWLHKRWKSTPTRTVLVLNDGRTGHLNQSLAVAREIQKARTAQGYGLDDTKIIRVDVKFKSPFLRSILSLSSAFASWRCHGRMRWMKLCLEKETYETLMKTYSEFVVSCGSSLAAVNIYMSKENNAKNIIIMKPDALVGLKKFSLAVIPKHDNPPKAKNVLVTTIAPNLIDEETLKRDGEMLKKRIQLGKKTVLGVLIGGDNPEYSLTGETIDNVIDGLLKFCDSTDAELLITTSRRTPTEAEAVLKNRLKDDHRCKLLVIANEANLEEAVGGILDLSSVIIVSGESISMVSEAISSRKKVVVFELENKKGVSTKHQAALKELERRGYISACTAKDLAPVIEKVYKD